MNEVGRKHSPDPFANPRFGDLASNVTVGVELCGMPQKNDRFTLNYEICDAGWAKASIWYHQHECVFHVSYLRDSLRQLAASACNLAEGAQQASIYFMEEPGEHELILTREASSSGCNFEVRWYEHWTWGAHDHTKSKQVLAGQISVHRYVQQIYSALCSIRSSVGEVEYERRWGYPFPLNEMNRLKGTAVRDS